MSFFDEVETTVANTRFLQAVEDSGPVKLTLQNYEQLAELDAKLQGSLTVKTLLKPKTVGYYLFKKFLKEDVEKKDRDALTVEFYDFLNRIEDYRKAKIDDRSTTGKQIIKDYLYRGDPKGREGEGDAVGQNSVAGGAGGAGGVGESASARNGGPAPVEDEEGKSAQDVAKTALLGANGAVGASDDDPRDTRDRDRDRDGKREVKDEPRPPPPLDFVPESLAHIIEFLPKGFSTLQQVWSDLGAGPPMSSWHAGNTSGSGGAGAAGAEGGPQGAGEGAGGSQGYAAQGGSSRRRYPAITVFEPVLEILSDGLGSVLNRFKATPHYQQYVQLQHYKSQPVQMKDFRVFRVLGRGAFGAVSAVQKIDTHAIFAMKEMGKRQVKQNQSEWMCINEKKVLSKMRSPFVLSLKYSFHNEENLFLIFDMCAGGDLKFHLRNNKEAYFNDERAKFYAAEVLLGLEHIHSFDIVYRDLKPTNILLDTKGHVKISDLGLTIKLRKNKVLKHLAGTAGYWAPEIVQKTGTYKTSDYWSFGVFLYEMLRGKRPRCSCRKQTKEWCPFGQKPAMEENALDKDGVLKLEVEYPAERFTADAIDLLEKLFEVDPKQRLGANGAQEIKNHPYFASINWDKLEALEIEPPFVPDSHTVHAHSIGEVGEFNKHRFRKVKLTGEDQKQYVNFNYVSEEAIEEELVEALTKIDAPPPTDQAQQSASHSPCPCAVL